jgi:hypothetical protein
MGAVMSKLLVVCRMTTIIDRRPFSAALFMKHKDKY